jgi:hypothetical protein
MGEVRIAAGRWSRHIRGDGVEFQRATSTGSLALDMAEIKLAGDDFEPFSTNLSSVRWTR